MGIVLKVTMEIRGLKVLSTIEITNNETGSSTSANYDTVMRNRRTLRRSFVKGFDTTNRDPWDLVCEAIENLLQEPEWE